MDGRERQVCVGLGNGEGWSVCVRAWRVWDCGSGCRGMFGLVGVGEGHL